MFDHAQKRSHYRPMNKLLWANTPSTSQWISPRYPTVLDWVAKTDFAFPFLMKPVQEGVAASLLVLLHDSDQSECQVAAMAGQITEGVAVVMPRGALKVGAGYAWGVPQTYPFGKAGRVGACVLEFQDFLASLQVWLGLGPQETVVAGFGQGGTLAASVFSDRQARAAGLGMLGCRLPSDVTSRGLSGHLPRRSVFVGHGVMDEVYPVVRAKESALWFAGQSIPCEQRRYLCRHELSPQMRDDFAAWFNRDWLDTLPLPSPLALAQRESSPGFRGREGLAECLRPGSRGSGETASARERTHMTWCAP